jgi:SOS response regulatory protein OraA/RecX
VPEAERAREAARRRLAALRRGAPERVAPRLRDYLLRRGYAPGIVADTLRGLLGATAAPDEAGDPDPPAGAGGS